MVHAASKENCSSINRIAIAETASLEEGDRPYPHVFLSREDGGGVRHRKTRFLFGSVWRCYLLITLLKIWLQFFQCFGLWWVRLSDPSKKRHSEGHGLDELVFFSDSPRVTIGK